MKSKFLKIIVFLFLFLIIWQVKALASVKKEGIENFPASYQPYLYELKKKHPNWVFTALYTGFDFNYVISQQYRNDKNLVPKSYSDSWKCTDNGIYDVEIDAGWVNASESAVRYTMDPRNFLNEIRIFQFEKLSYDPNTNTQSGVEKILYGTEFYNRLVSYRNAAGAVINTDRKYSDLIWDSAIYSGVSPYHIASRIKQEVGPFISHNSISGTVAGFEGLYNFYNIGATSSAEPLGAIKNGLQFAKDGKGASEEVKANLFIPWNTPERAIKGGAVFIGSSYINVGQNTLYLQKFDVNDDRGNDLFWHQYMTNCLAPYSESVGIYNAYQSNSMLDSSIGFLIPVYENMPEYAQESPNISESDFQNDNTKMYPDVTGNLNVRTGPSTSYEILTSINRNDIVTRIKVGVQNGERWDKIKLSNGMVGYVFQSYLKEVQQPSISKIQLSVDNTKIQKGSTQSIKITIEPSDAKQEEIVWSSSDENIVSVDNGIIRAMANGTAIITAKTADNRVSADIEIMVYTPASDIVISNEDIQLLVGNTAKLTANVLPEDASNKNVIWESADSSIATVDKNGVVTAIAVGETQVSVKTQDGGNKTKCRVEVKELPEGTQVEFAPSLRIESNEISNIDISKSSVQEIKTLITTNLTIEMYNVENKLLEDTDMIGTGSTLVLKNEQGEEVLKYIFVIYGDVNGDGAINALDVLIIQRHILEIDTLHGIMLKAGNIAKDNEMPSALDVLKIQRHILEIASIKQ